MMALPYFTVDNEQIGFFLIVVRQRLAFIAQLVMVVLQKQIHIIPHGLRNIGTEIFQGFPAGGGYGVMGAVADLPGTDELGVCQLVEGLLEGKVVGIALIKDIK